MVQRRATKVSGKNGRRVTKEDEKQMEWEKSSAEDVVAR